MQPYNNFDRVARFYDGLCRLVFGSTVKKAQVDLLKHIPAQARVLIVGGGTGWILDEIARMHPSGLHITYIDSSAKMIQRSKKRDVLRCTVHFIEAPIENVPLPPDSYDVILTPFLLDNFQQSKCLAILAQLDTALKKDGLWLYTDFYISGKSKYWQKILLRFMYAFFRFAGHIETNRLPVVDHYFSKYTVMVENRYCKDFIIAKAFRK